MGCRTDKCDYPVMSAPVRQFSFSAGELSPSLYARSDLDRYANGVRTLRNMMVMRQGGATGRPGTEYVSTALNGGNQVRLIPFIFNETGFGQSYVLEFGNQYIAFYQNGGNVISSTKTITNITQANPATVTAASHGFSNGDIVTMTSVLGMTQVDNAYFIVANVTTNTFTLKDLLGNAINSSAYSAYISGGIASKIYIISSPYLQADLATLDYGQCADILTIVHPSYPPKELARSGQTNWVLNSITFAPPIAGPSVVSLVGTSGTNFYGYAVTSVNANGEESDLLQLGYSAQRLTLPSISTPITVSWGQVSGAVYYRVYFDNNPVLFSFALHPTQLGFVGQTTGLSFIDSGFTPDYTSTPPISTTSVTPNLPFDIFSPLFSTENNYPSTVGFVQQRRAFGATNNNPVGFWISQPGDFYNFDTHVSPTDSDGIIGSIAGEEVNKIQHILELKFMLMLTAGAEMYIQGNGAGIVTPSAINASAQSQYGSSPLKPLKVSDILLFNQALGSAVRDFTFDFATDGYRGNDITIFSAHFFEGYQISDWAYQKVPDSIVWTVRSDGKLLSCTYVREQQILGWAEHDFTNGLVENVCSIPENSEYAVYLSIKRVINGQTVRYIERLSSRLWPDTVNTPPVQNDPINASYLDCFIKYDGRNTSSTTMEVTAPGNTFDETSLAYQQQLTIKSSVDYFTSAMIGDQIFVFDETFIQSKGADGNQIRCTIQSIVNTKAAIATSNEIVPVEFRSTSGMGVITTTLWARAVQTVSGLEYLEGQDVSVWADRFVVGSPLNSQVSPVYTVADGSLTLDKPYSVIYVGLPMTQDLEPLDLESYFGETMLARRKRISQVSVYVYNTRTFFAGGENPDTNENNTDDDPLFELYEEKDGASQATYDVAPALLTKQDYVITPSRWTNSGRCFFRNVDPVPFSLLAIAPFSEDPVQTGYKRGG